MSHLRKLCCELLLALVTAAGLSGCRHAKEMSQSDQIAEALNRFYADEPACLWQEMTSLDAEREAPHRPLSVGDSGVSRAMTLDQAAALVKAGLITRLDHGYALTDEGRKAWRSKPREPGLGNLCYGYWHVDGVGKLQPRHDDLFGDATETDFTAMVATPAAWTAVPEMRQAFPLMALEVSRPLPHVATMKHTDSGWQVAAAVADTAFP